MSRHAIEVDTPDLIDAVQKANSIAPKRGSAFDKAAGIRFEVQPPFLLVKATDLDTSYRCQVLLVHHGENLPEPFRVPASVLAAYLTQLPTGEESTTVITPAPADHKVTFESGDCRARFTTITGDSFPMIDEFDTTDMAEVDTLAAQLRRVSWACSRDSVPLDGIHISGSQLVGCDHSKIAVVDCPVPVDEPVTAPLAGVTAALRGHKGPVTMAVLDKKLLLMPDPDVQFATTLYAAAYPKVDMLLGLAEGNTSTWVHRAVLDEALARINALCGGERYPVMNIELFDDQLALEADIKELGRVEEAVTLEHGLPPGDEISIRLDPAKLASAIGATSSPTIEITWPVGRPNKPIQVRDERLGYSVVLMPLRSS